MSGQGILGAAAILGFLALLATPWMHRLARKDAPLVSSGLHIALAALGGAGAAAFADGWIELLALASAALACALLVTIDLAVHRLPDALISPVFPVLLGCFALHAVLESDYSSLLRALLAGAVMGVGYLVLALISPTGLGFGDVKLAAMLGVLLGWYGWAEVLTGTLAAFILGGIFAVVLLVASRATRKTQIAFGPWMIAGAVIGLLAGQAVFGS